MVKVQSRVVNAVMDCLSEHGPTRPIRCRALGLVSLLILSSPSLSAQVPSPTSSNATTQPHTRPAEIQAAKEALRSAHNAKTLTALNNAVTRASAARLAVVSVSYLTLFLGTVDLNVSQGASAPAPHMARVKARLRRIGRELKALEKRYHMTDKQQAAILDSGYVISPYQQSRGHPFFQDVIALITRLERLPAHVTRQLYVLGLSTPERYTYRVQSPTQVLITPHTGKMPPLESHWEDGEWRIDTGRSPLFRMPETHHKPLT